jgi:hypothetical protein
MIRALIHREIQIALRRRSLVRSISMQGLGEKLHVEGRLDQVREGELLALAEGGEEGLRGVGEVGGEDAVD